MDTIDSRHISLNKLTLLFPPDIEQAFQLDQLSARQAFFRTSLFLSLFFACAAICSFLVLKPAALSNLPLLFFALIFAGVLFKIRYLYVALSGLLLILLYGVSLIVFTKIGPAHILINIGFVFFAGTIGVAASYAVEYYNRMFFLKSLILEKTLNDTRKKEGQLNSELIRANKSLEIEIRAHTEAESQLRESEEKYRNLVNSIPDGIFIAQNKQIVFLNPSMERLTGYLREELLGKDADSLFIRKATKFEQKENHDVFVHRDGHSIFVEKSYVEIIYNAEPALLFTVRDISGRIHADQKQKQLKKELERAKKMEAFGILAGGVAHDLNNVLSGLITAPDAMLNDLPEGSNLAAHAQAIKASGKRAFNIADELLTMVRGSSRALAPVRLNDMFEDYFLSPEFDALNEQFSDVTIEKELCHDLPIFNASDIHIRKIVMNLISNAVEAAGPEKGKVKIETCTVEFNNQRIKGYEKVKDGRYIKFSVMNTGKGISKKDIDHIFEPFYSKKILGRSGTGLGLSIVWSVVHDHDGYIHVSSNDQRTYFTVYLPISDGYVQMAENPVKVYTLDDYRGNNETVLVVDDMPEQQKIAVNMLKRLGYQVWTADSGEKAIQFVRETTVDLVVLDMVMDPGLNGLETYKELILIDPQIKAIITSGYSYDDDMKTIQNLGAGQFIKKPYSLESLGMAIKNEFSDRKL